MNIICKEYSQIYSNICYTLVGAGFPSCTRHLFVYFLAGPQELHYALFTHSAVQIYTGNTFLPWVQ